MLTVAPSATREQERTFMAEQQPRVEVFSRNKVSRSRISFIAVAIPMTAISGLIVYALLPFILIIGYGLLALATIGALYLVALLGVDIYKRLLYAKIVHLGEHGAIDAQQWRMLPLALSPVSVTEVPGELSAEDKEIIQRSKVLAAHFIEGKGMHAIEKELGIPYNKVRDWCNTANALRTRQQSW